MLVVIVSYYVLFAVMGASRRTLTIEIVVASGFLLFAVLGFKRNVWLVAAALVGHGVFDFVRGLFIDNPGVPHWWPGFCLAFDVLVGVLLAARLIGHPDLRASTRRIDTPVRRTEESSFLGSEGHNSHDPNIQGNWPNGKKAPKYEGP